LALKFTKFDLMLLKVIVDALLDVCHCLQMAIYTGKDANRPKRPQSAYFLWLADFRALMKDKFVENRDILRAGQSVDIS